MSRDRDDEEMTDRERKYLETHFSIPATVREAWAAQDNPKARRVAETQADRDWWTAAAGVNPITGSWWPSWRPWPTAAQRAQAQGRWRASWFTPGEQGTGRSAGQRTSERKRETCRRNGPRGASYGVLGREFGVLGAAFGMLGGRPRGVNA